MALAAPRPSVDEADLRIREKIRAFVADTFFVDAFSDQDSFLQTGIIDSNGMMALVVFVEQQFAITVDDAELLPENLDSLDNLSEFIRRKHSGGLQA